MYTCSLSTVILVFWLLVSSWRRAPRAWKEEADREYQAVSSTPSLHSVLIFFFPVTQTQIFSVVCAHLHIHHAQDNGMNPHRQMEWEAESQQGKVLSDNIGNKVQKWFC